jgi:hypothetical protein
MRRSTLLAGLAPFLLLTAAHSSGQPMLHPQRFTQPLDPREGAVGVPYWGFVTEVAKDSITIQWVVNRVASRDVKPKRFPVSETLAAGLVPIEPRPRPDGKGKYLVLPSDMYRLQDVKVGDGVSILYARLGGVDICDHIAIWKRPGGRIPRLPEEAEEIRKAERLSAFDFLPKAELKKIEDSYIRHDEYWNAYWDLEEKGIPFPEKFGGNRRWPVAPMPREKGFAGPVISQ